MAPKQLSIALNVAIATTSENLWPIFNKLERQGEISKSRSWRITTSIFLAMLATSTACFTGAMRFKVNHGEFKGWISQYIQAYLKLISKSYKIDVENIGKIWLSMYEAFNPLLHECAITGARSRKEVLKKRFLLVLAFAGMLAKNREQYGQGKPFDDAVMRDIFNVINFMMSKISDEFLPEKIRATIVHISKRQVSGLLKNLVFRRAALVLASYWLLLIVYLAVFKDASGYYFEDGFADFCKYGLVPPAVLSVIFIGFKKFWR